MSATDHIAHELRSAWNTRSEPESMRILAGSFWRLSLLSAILLVGVLALYGGFVFFAVLDPSSDDSTLVPGGNDAMFDRAELDRILDEFEARKERYESLKATVPIADPSR